MITATKNAILYTGCGERVRIEAWGKNALRVRATKKPTFSDRVGALEEKVSARGVKTSADENAVIENGKIRAELSREGKITFYDGKKKLLEEMYRIRSVPTVHINALFMASREYSGIPGGEYEITLRFEPNEGEHLYGMGQYQQPYLDLKGCSLELKQRNGQITVPFVLSSLGYGFLWNTSAVGRAFFGKNMTEWRFDMEDEIDYYICAGDSPAEILSTYTAAVGRVPRMPRELLGLWQCKLRYRTQEEVLEVAREYRRREIPLDVIVIDYLHWPSFGDWCLDEKCFPDPSAMTRELASMGVKPMVSVWPAVEKKSRNYESMREAGYFVGTDRGLAIHTDFFNLTYFDATDPEARQYVWERLREGYVKHGICHFWLDCAEPEFRGYHLDNYRYHIGNALKTANEYPKHYTKMVWEGLKKEGGQDPVSLVRSAWTGSQKYGALVWSGDVESTFEALRNQVQAGISMGLCGFAWWTTDIGGFLHGDVDDPGFRELLIRWFEYGVFCPILRMHGDRMSSSHVPDGKPYSPPNELWSYGEEVYEILRRYVGLREELKDYIEGLMREASSSGAPLIRAMFYEFPNDEICYTLSDQYMFGPRYLVAPVLSLGARERSLYLPHGRWRAMASGEILEGGRRVSVPAPPEVIPVFERL